MHKLCTSYLHRSSVKGREREVGAGWRFPCLSLSFSCIALPCADLSLVCLALSHA